MAKYNDADVVAYWFDEEKMAHVGCLDDKEIEDQDCVITQTDIDTADNMYFCDVCGKRIR